MIEPSAGLVSVVIPTRNRSELLMRALRSVFNQTYDEIEIIVVVDGPDPVTVSALHAISNDRLHVIVNPRSMTAAGARNIGANRATGEWITFLDDDDEWLPTKIAKQLEFVSGQRTVLVSCLSRVVAPHWERVQPEVIYDNVTPLEEYLFDRRSLFKKVGYIQTSSYLLCRSLFERIRFRIGNAHDDWDFLVRASKILKIRVETVPEVLVNIYVGEERPFLSESGSWKESFRWVEDIRGLITRRAYSGFCLGVAGSRAARERDLVGCFQLLYQAFKYGSPRPVQVCILIGLWVVPKLFHPKTWRVVARPGRGGKITSAKRD